MRSLLLGLGAVLLAGGLAAGLVPAVQASSSPPVPRLTQAPLEAAKNPFVLPGYAAVSTPSPTSTPGVIDALVGAGGGNPQVTSVFVGAQPFAVVQDGGQQKQVGIGDKLDGHTVMSITLDGVLLDDGYLLSANPLAGNYAAPEPTPLATAPVSNPAPVAPMIFMPPQVTQTPPPRRSEVERPPLPYSLTSTPSPGGWNRPALPYGMAPPPSATGN